MNLIRTSSKLSDNILQVFGDSRLTPQDKYAAVLKTVPSTISAALDCPPIKDLLNQGLEVNHLHACLAIEIARIANMLTVGGNLRQGQSLEIAKILISEYPGESLQDFCLCLRNGIKGKYPIDGKSDIFRFDVLVIINWFKAYLLEKYAAVEERLMREKDNQYTSVKTTADLPPQVGYKIVWDYPWVFAPVRNHEARMILWRDRWNAMGRLTPKPVAPLSDKDVRQEGQPRPKRKIFINDVDYIERRKIKDQITRTAADYYAGRFSFWNLKTYKVSGFEILAESQKDAEEIYSIANPNESDIVSRQANS